MKHLKSAIGYIVVSGFGVYCLYLYYTGKMNFYIHPRYTDFAVIMAWVAVIAGFAFVIRYIESSGKFQDGEEDHHHKHSELANEHGDNRSWLSKAQSYAAAGLLVLPLVLGFLLPVKPLSAVTAQQRSIDFNTIRGESTANLFLKNTKTYTLGDWIKVINNNPDITRYVGKEIKVSGFIFNPEQTENEFFVSRFLITCCAVDARPLGLRVQHDWQKDFRENQWVEVEGKFKLIKKDESSTLVIEPSSVRNILEPTDPYVF